MQVNQTNYIKLLDESFPGIRQNIMRTQALGFPWEASRLFIKKKNGRAVSHVALLECQALFDGQS
jgi:hypothetical protein